MALPSLSARRDEAGRRADPAGRLRGAPGPWRQPVVWLGVAVMLASFAGCLFMILLALRQPDEPPPAGVDHIMKMPVERMPADPPR